MYLALACFVGLLAIFFFDAYVGLYDTIYFTAGEREERIEADYWLGQDSRIASGMKGAYYLSVNRADKVFFSYEVDNRQFSGYTADVEVTIWQSQQKVGDLLSAPMVIDAFDKGQLEWVLDTDELLPEYTSQDQSFEYTLTIKRGEAERNIILHVTSSDYPIKPVPVPSR